MLWVCTYSWRRLVLRFVYRMRHHWGYLQIIWNSEHRQTEILNVIKSKKANHYGGREASNTSIGYIHHHRNDKKLLFFFRLDMICENRIRVKTYLFLRKRVLFKILLRVFRGHFQTPLYDKYLFPQLILFKGYLGIEHAKFLFRGKILVQGVALPY